MEYVVKTGVDNQLILQSGSQRLERDGQFYRFVFFDKLEEVDLRPILAKAQQLIVDNQETFLLMADITKLKEVSINSRKIGVAWLRSNAKKARIAVATQTVFMTYFIKMIIAVSEAGDHMRGFKTVHEAENWLMAYIESNGRLGN